MWLDPTNTHVAGSSKSWLVLNENEFFVLQQYQPGLNNDIDDISSVPLPRARFRILFNSKEPNAQLVIAQASESAQICENWDWLEFTLYPQLQMFDRSCKEDEIELHQYIILKLSSMHTAEKLSQPLGPVSLRIPVPPTPTHDAAPSSSYSTSTPNNSNLIDSGMRGVGGTPSAAYSSSVGGTPTPSTPVLVHKDLANLSARHRFRSLTPQATARAPESRFAEGTSGFFHEQFGRFDDRFITCYPCRLWYHTVLKGDLYITSGSLCFHSKLQRQTNISLSFSDVDQLNATKSFHLTSESIHVIDKLGNEYMFSDFQKEFTTVYLLVNWLWQYQMFSHLSAVEEGLVQESEDKHRELNQTNSTELPACNPRDPSPSSSIHDSPGVALNTLQVVYSVDFIVQEAKHRRFRQLFKLQASESLQAYAPCELKSGMVQCTGTLFVSERFLCFSSLPFPIAPSHDEIGTMVVLYARKITAIEFLHTGKLIVSTKNRVFTFANLDTSRGSAYKTASRLWKRKWAVASSVSDIPTKLRSSHVMRAVKEKQLFFDDYVVDEAESEQWSSYVTKNGIGMDMILTSELSRLVRHSVPRKYRGILWLTWTGAKIKQECNSSEYTALLRENAGRRSFCTEEIERDLCRTFPEHPFYQTEEGISLLRRVLTAYAFRNPAIGYCQSMNIVCAFLALFMSEEEAFWMITTLCEDLLPGYYVPSMAGSSSDQLLFEKLLAEHLPDITAHLALLEVPIALITIPWLLCLFIGFLPWDLTLRVLDCFFLDGRRVFFIIGLAIFKYFREQLLQMDDSGSAIELLKNPCPDTKTLLNMAFSDFGHLTIDKTERLHTAQLARTIRDLHLKAASRRPATSKELTHSSSEVPAKLRRTRSQSSFAVPTISMPTLDESPGAAPPATARATVTTSVAGTHALELAQEVGQAASDALSTFGLTAMRAASQTGEALGSYASSSLNKLKALPEQRRSAFLAKSLRSSRQFEIRLSSNFKFGEIGHVLSSSSDADSSDDEEYVVRDASSSST